MTRHHDTVHGLAITLDETFESRLGPARTLACAQLLVSVHNAGHDDPNLQALLEERLGSAGFDLPSYSYHRLAEQLSMAPAGQLTVRNTHGAVLAGPGKRESEQVPGVHGAEDLADSHRPFYS